MSEKPICPTLARPQREEQEFCDAALDFPFSSKDAISYREYAKEAIRQQGLHKSDCPLCRDAVAQKERSDEPDRAVCNSFSVNQSSTIR